MNMQNQRQSYANVLNNTKIHDKYNFNITKEIEDGPSRRTNIAKSNGHIQQGFIRNTSREMNAPRRPTGRYQTFFLEIVGLIVTLVINLSTIKKIL